LISKNSHELHHNLERESLSFTNRFHHCFSIIEKEIMQYVITLFVTGQPGPGAAREKFNAFFVKQSFFSSDLLRFWSLGYPGVKGLP